MYDSNDNKADIEGVNDIKKTKGLIEMRASPWRQTSRFPRKLSERLQKKAVPIPIKRTVTALMPSTSHGPRKNAAPVSPLSPRQQPGHITLSALLQTSKPTHTKSLFSE